MWSDLEPLGRIPFAGDCAKREQEHAEPPSHALRCYFKRTHLASFPDFLTFHAFFAHTA